MNTKKHHIIFFDGHCILCNRYVQFVLKWDHNDSIRFTTTNSNTASLYASKLDASIDSIILLDQQENIFYKSSAVIRVLEIIAYPRWICNLLKCIPIIIRDYIYDFIAKRRYRVFGKLEHCPVPKKKFTYKFLP